MSTAAGLNYERSGKGEPVLLLHGLGGELGVWEPVVGPLSEQRELIAVDLPGFGASPPLAGEADPTPAAMAAALPAVLDELGIERAHVVGNSLGAWIAFELALLGRALSVTALAPAGLWGKPLKQRPERPARWLGRRLLPLTPLVMRSKRARRLAFRWTVAYPDRLSPSVAARMARNYLESPAYAAADAAMRRSRFTAGDELAVPVTIVWCELDRQVSPPERELPWATIVTLPDCGHLPMWDNPALTARAILEATSSVGGRIRAGDGGEM